MATTCFPLSVSHSQIAVFGGALAQPFSMWSERHVNQGFVWRKGTVSFRTIADGRHLVEVIVTAKNIDLSSEAVRVIQVPFEGPSSGSIEIASIADAFPLDLPFGMYALRFECFRLDGCLEPRIRLIFFRRADPRFEVLRADADLSITGEFLHTASPA
jgi:hypothetical protein